MFPNIILSVLIIHNGRYYRRQNSNDHEKLGKNPLKEERKQRSVLMMIPTQIQNTVRPH